MIYTTPYRFKRCVTGVDDAAVSAAAISAAGSIGSAAITGVTSSNLNRKNRKWQEKVMQEQKDWNEMMWNKQNAWNYEMWQEQNAYNTPEAQIQRMRDAGLNPLFYGLDGSSAGDLSAGQPLGYESATQSPYTNNPATDAGQAFMSMLSLAKEVQLKNAEIDKLNKESNSLELDNQWKDMTLQARAEAEELKNEALRGDIKIKAQDLKNKVQEFDKLVAETDNAIAEKGYILAKTATETALKAKTDEERATIVALRPWQIKLTQAQTLAQKAAASQGFANALYTNHLVESGYIEKQVDEIAARCAYYDELKNNAEVQRFMQEYKNSLKTGTVMDFLNGYKPTGKVERFINDFLGSTFQFFSVAGDAINGIPGVSSAVGAAIGGAAGSSYGASQASDASAVNKQIDALGGY